MLTDEKCHHANRQLSYRNQATNQVISHTHQQLLPSHSCRRRACHNPHAGPSVSCPWCLVNAGGYSQALVMTVEGARPRACMMRCFLQQTQRHEDKNQSVLKKNAATQATALSHEAAAVSVLGLHAGRDCKTTLQREQLPQRLPLYILRGFAAVLSSTAPLRPPTNPATLCCSPWQGHVLA